MLALMSYYIYYAEILLLTKDPPLPKTDVCRLRGFFPLLLRPLAIGSLKTSIYSFSDCSSSLNSSSCTSFLVFASREQTGMLRKTPLYLLKVSTVLSLYNTTYFHCNLNQPLYNLFNIRLIYIRFNKVIYIL